VTADARRTLTLCESVLRDGIQGWPHFIPTNEKIRLAEAIAAAGFPELDVTSFVPVAVVPQFADAADVLAAIPSSIAARVLTVNERGVERVIAAHQQIRPIECCGMPFSASEPHNIANLRRTHAEHRVQVARMVDSLLGAGIRPLVAVATAYGCPIRGRVDPGEVLELAGWLHALGVRRIMFGDTTGTADPRRARELFAAAVAQWPDAEFIAHFHDNRGCGMANSLAAIEAGATTVDSSLGGLGGEPLSVDQGDVGESGNVATEDLAAVLARMGIVTGLDLDRVLAAATIAESIAGRRLHGRVLRAGLVRDEPAREGV
jgi:hydroxymethylglutaryl-CoA lyase